jgi:hypothetical protein
MFAKSMSTGHGNHWDCDIIIKANFTKGMRIAAAATCILAGTSRATMISPGGP